MPGATFIRISLGVFFVVLGIIGCVLPFLQGWLCFLIALILFFPNHPRVEKILQKVGPRFPRLVHALRRLGVGAAAPDTPESLPHS